MFDFMGVAVAYITPEYQREVIVIGMDLVPGSHNAENIKAAIEKIVNGYKFVFTSHAFMVALAMRGVRMSGL